MSTTGRNVIAEWHRETPKLNVHILCHPEHLTVIVRERGKDGSTTVQIALTDRAKEYLRECGVLPDMFGWPMGYAPSQMGERIKMPVSKRVAS